MTDADRIAELEAKLATAESRIKIMAEIGVEIQNERLARYERAARELPDEPACIQYWRVANRTNSEQQAIDYIDKLRDAAVALKAEVARLKGSEGAIAMVQADELYKQLKESQTALATARQQERERCAKICELQDCDQSEYSCHTLARSTAAIRALHDQEES